MAENAVSLKLPTFWTSQPEIWFTQAEAQFHVRGITADTTKYYYVVAALDQPTAGRLLDALQSPPSTKTSNSSCSERSASPGVNGQPSCSTWRISALAIGKPLQFSLTCARSHLAILHVCCLKKFSYDNTSEGIAVECVQLIQIDNNKGTTSTAMTSTIASMEANKFFLITVLLCTQLHWL